MIGSTDKGYGFTREGLATIGRNLRLAHEPPPQPEFLDLLEAIDAADAKPSLPRAKS